ncbi:hypothetical protein [Emticicia fluvialis]|uniref:hypothetical protein n=1 Tax=Emticicia fluvialis TaxID=2974474 RepID=UPI002166412D|nr:hypothetical protein [Emticicia fluvialis]
MKQTAFELGEHLLLRNISYYPSPILWEKWDIDSLDIKFNKWKVIKYLNDDGDDLNIDISKVPNDKGGLYLFYVNCNQISGISELPFYVGRAQLTEGQNLRKRVREYFTKFSKDDERPKITRMFKYWSKELYLAFLVLENNICIVDLEKKLINSLLLPMNDEIPDKETKEAVKAFNL